MPRGRETQAAETTPVALRSTGSERWLFAAVLVAGAALLWSLLSRTDIAEVWARLEGVSSAGLALVLGAYLVAHLAETVSWLQTLPEMSLSARSVYRLWKVLTVGSAVERVTPFAGLGGEPVKAILLNRYSGVPYAAATASLLITRMTDVIALAVFVGVGLCLMWTRDLFPPAYRTAALVAWPFSSSSAACSS